jgi:hypothetical protein
MLESALPVQEKGYAQGAESAYSLARTCAPLGRKKESMQYLQAAYDRRESEFLFLRNDPAFNNLREERPFKELAARVGVPRPD